MDAEFGLLMIVVAGFIWLLPILLILGSNKTAGGEKLAWVLAVIFVSWFAWIIYLLIAPVSNRSGIPR
ncbi:hypothetical protein IDSA_07890 [Pseudidiomarina salinarum]|uniref:Cardiolipin synthase N-terminal domain-containing protein n=1 Tax=Pseudidiomarina salinarum TaxID=435908 RepID=A0A094IV39_9GAMM|nr:hypothetical protein [Pseudidiomarina salinarum]KFZ30982.1 hypothetical protein IDSA_07890 [Pseudidiomarina salinarum]